VRTLTAVLHAFVIATAMAGAGCTADPGSGDPPGTFSEVYDLYFPPTTNARCNFCHSMPASDISNGNLSTGTDQESTYAALVGPTSTSSKCSGKAFVVPFQPDQSLLVDKLGDTPVCGDRMPLGGMALDHAQLDLVVSWIEAGAQND
jgi:hypothetical protein